MSLAVTFVLQHNDESFHTAVFPHIKACEDLYSANPDLIKDVYIFNFPNKESGVIESLKSLKLWRDKHIQLFAFMPTSEILNNFSKKNVVYITGERSPLMVEADSRGCRVLHNVSSMTRDSIGQSYDPHQVDTLYKHLCSDEGPTLVIDVPLTTSSSLTGISKAFVINLDRRLDRWELFKKNHPQLYPLVTRTSAVDGKKIQLTQIMHLVI